MLRRPHPGDGHYVSRPIRNQSEEETLMIVTLGRGLNELRFTFVNAIPRIDKLHMGNAAYKKTP
jgi:hypothetical protein